MRKYTMVDRVTGDEIVAIPRETGGPVVPRPRQECWWCPWSPVLSGSAALCSC